MATKCCSIRALAKVVFAGAICAIPSVIIGHSTSARAPLPAQGDETSTPAENAQPEEPEILTDEQFARLESIQADVIKFRRGVIFIDTFAGFWVDSDAVVHVAFVGDPPALDVPATLTVVVEKADFLFSELEGAQQQISASAEDAADQWVVATAVDEVRNRVVLFTTDPKRPLPAEYNFVDQNDDAMVEIDPRINGGEPTTIIRGGQGMANGCTAGFAVKAGPYRGMITAGHPGCGDSSSNSQAGVPLCCVQQVVYSGGQDRSVYAISATGHGVSRKIKISSSGTRDITGTYANSDFYVGFVSEKYGNSSGYRTGQILNPNFDPSWVPGTGYFIQMSTAVPSWPGDSGGPNFFNNKAVGVTDGCNYFAPATSCASSQPAGYNRAIVGKIQAQLTGLGSWTLYLNATDGQ